MITIISGTNRTDSKSRKIANYYSKILATMDQESKIIDLCDLPTKFLFSAMYHNAGKDKEFNIFKENINQSSKFIFIVPEYNGSFPGVLKAFIDGLDYKSSFNNKKCILVGISAGNMAGALALSHLTDILNYMGMHVHAIKTRLPLINTLLVNDIITDKFLENLIVTQLKAFLEF